LIHDICLHSLRLIQHHCLRGRADLERLNKPTNYYDSLRLMIVDDEKSKSSVCNRLWSFSVFVQCQCWMKTLSQCLQNPLRLMSSFCEHPSFVTLPSNVESFISTAVFHLFLIAIQRR
jgi:hypothetical protein